MQWYYHSGDKQLGPHDLDTIFDRISKGDIGGQTHVWHAGMAEWEPAIEQAELQSHLGLAPPPYIQVPETARGAGRAVGPWLRYSLLVIAALIAFCIARALWLPMPQPNTRPGLDTLLVYTFAYSFYFLIVWGPLTMLAVVISLARRRSPLAALKVALLLACVVLALLIRGGEYTTIHGVSAIGGFLASGGWPWSSLGN